MSRDEELEALRAGVSCAVVLETHPPPWQLDKRESTKRCLKYRRGEGEIILVTHEGRGWWDPGSTAKGDVFSLVQHLEPGLNLGQVRKVLRPLAGLSPSFPPHLQTTDRKRPGLLFDARWERRLPPGLCHGGVALSHRRPPTSTGSRGRGDPRRGATRGSKRQRLVRPPRP